MPSPLPTPALPQIAVIGAGPAGLMAAESLARGPARVTVYDRMPSAGRKFLLAGRGGLNLTHSDELERLLDRYGAAGPRLRAAITAFPPAALRAWCEALGQATFVGSSGRVFPQAFKASPLLRAWLKQLAAAGVQFKPRHHWAGWDDGALVFAAPGGPARVVPDATVLALGGASWPRLGSDGGWVDVLTKAGITVTPLVPANCGFAAAWSDVFISRHEGQPLKRVALSFAGRTVRGEVVITRHGLEGGAVYALSAPLRDGLAVAGEAIMHIDMRPDLAVDALAARLAAARGKQSLATFLRKAAALAPAAIGLLHEACLPSPASLAAMTPAALAALIKAVPVRLTAAADLARAISTAGGIAWDEIDERFMLRRRPGVFVAGEMLDWEAPTGGYLMQGAFSTAAAAAHGLREWLARDRVTQAGRPPLTLNDEYIPAPKDDAF
ncbi:MAG TPA: TIGR03862 family flavoprotein [Xanthobacteraceae bacterium]